MFPARTTTGLLPETEGDKYEMLQYFVAKLETRTKLDDIYKFLLEFLRTMVSKAGQLPPSCIFLVNTETLYFDLSVSEPDDIDRDIFNKELAWQIENGIVAHCLGNRKTSFSPAAYSGSSGNILLVPLTTTERVLGLALLYTDINECTFQRELLQIIKLAGIQTALYIDNLSMVNELKNTQARVIHTEKLSAIGQLAAGIAHEINNPASFILNNCEILDEYFKTLITFLKLYDSKTTEHIKCKYEEFDIEYIIQDAPSLIASNIEGLKRITQIVANLKDFAHLNQKETFELCNLEDNVRKTLVIANNEIKYYAEVITQFSNISRVKCNHGEINQVFLNIIINAAQAIREFSKDRRGLITIRSYEDTSSVYFEFSDTGPGIPDHVLPKIFDPFFTTKPVGKGTGLGLNIAYDIIVNKHHGDISVKTELGKGTTFIVQLPKFE
jgi:signal transduction histidine kinase